MRHSVLIVDDSPTIRALIKVHLTGFKLEFYEADDGVEGLSLARKQRPDLIIADLRMPNMDGFSFCRAVRADAVLRATPIALLTSAKDSDVRVEAIAAGASVFLTKPIDGPKLAEFLRSRLVGSA
jgi:twitching motility two-component system response regulator PilG